MSGDRVEAFIAEIEASPAASTRLLDAYEADDVALGTLQTIAGSIRSVAFTGLGSSRYAALVAAADLRSRGVAAWAEYPAATLAAPPATDTLVIAISASGGTAEVVAAAERHRGRGPVVAVTNHPESPLAAVADLVLPLHAGEERSGISTLTFRGTLAVLGLVAGRLTGRGPSTADLRPAVVALDAVIGSRDEWLFEAADAFDGAPRIDVVADAAAIGTAEQAALMLREAPRLPATAYETADWLHTAIYLALPGHRVLAIEGSPADVSVARVVGGRGGQFIAVGCDIDGVVASIPLPEMVDAYGQAMVTSVVADLLAAELWRRTTASEA
ncbi:MAG TPA: SIS domain-containing protein [Candidatus Saccharimonadales bacterium]|nr:SIS domain-containing protein [Candidatus Saccharimonadales bacterium]